MNPGVLQRLRRSLSVEEPRPADTKHTCASIRPLAPILSLLLFSFCLPLRLFSWVLSLPTSLVLALSLLCKSQEMSFQCPFTESPPKRALQLAHSTSSNGALALGCRLADPAPPKDALLHVEWVIQMLDGSHHLDLQDLFRTALSHNGVCRRDLI